MMWPKALFFYSKAFENFIYYINTFLKINNKNLNLKYTKYKKNKNKPD